VGAGRLKSKIIPVALLAVVRSTDKSCAFVVGWDIARDRLAEQRGNRSFSAA